MKACITSSQSGVGAFSLVEVISVIAVISVLSAVGAIATNGLRTNVSASKLKQDVRLINTAIRVYEASGGDLGSAGSPDQILDKLKSSADEDSAKVIAGLTGRMIDAELVAVYQTAPEARSDQPRVLWNSAEKQLTIATSGGRGVKEFRLDQAEAGRRRANQKETRDRNAMDLARQDPWIWDYTDVSSATTGGPTAVSLGTGPGPTPTPSTLPMNRLSPPVFSIPPGNYPLVNYNLSLTLTNPNDPAISTILFSNVPGVWEIYDGTPISVNAATQVRAFVLSEDPANWYNSVPVSNNYVVDLVAPELYIIVPSTSVTYADVGGPMMPGGPALSPAAPANITLVNSGAIPVDYQNSDTFSVLYSNDGSDPQIAVDAFSGGFPGQTIDYLLGNWGGGSTLTLKAQAVSHRPALVPDSRVTSRTLSISRTLLRAPLQANVNEEVTISPEVTFGDIPQGARIYYTIDGTDPGDVNGEPTVGEPYLGPFTLPRGSGATVRVTARLYGPPGYQHWFNVSDSATLDVVTPPAAINFSHSASLTAP